MMYDAHMAHFACHTVGAVVDLAVVHNAAADTRT